MAEKPQENVPESSKSVKELTASDYNCEWNVVHIVHDCRQFVIQRK